MDKIRNLEADIVVIGAGCGGLSAALEAVSQGAEKVIVLEGGRRTGGALQYTSGSMSAACTAIQREEGIEDSIDSYVSDIMKNGSDFGGKPNKELVTIYANEAGKTFDWLYENGLKDNSYITDRRSGKRAAFAPEHALYSVPRTYKPLPIDKENYKSAAHEVLDSLVKDQDKIEILFRTKAKEFIVTTKARF